MDPDEEAFLAAIRADDDVARFAFADWLDERGDRRGPWVRNPAPWKHLATIGGADPVVLLGHPDPEERLRAIEVLGQIGPRAIAAVPALRAARDDEDEEVRQAATAALAAIAPGAP